MTKRRYIVLSLLVVILYLSTIIPMLWVDNPWLRGIASGIVGFLSFSAMFWVRERYTASRRD